MNDEVEPKPKQTPAEIVGNIVTRAIEGWPVYGIIVALMWGYAELYLGDMISTQIKEETGRTETVSALSQNVALNTDAVEDLEAAVTRLDTSIQTLNTDVKETLRIIAAKTP